jgi:gliding motility-associated-like protein
MFNACHLYTNPGKYNVRLIVQNSVGCIDTLLRKVTVYKHPKADFTVPEVCSRESVVFKNLSQPGDTVITRYSWHFGDMNNPVDTSNLKSPDYIYPRDGIYLVHLLVKDAFGCSDTLTKHETVLLSPVSAFTIIKDINGVPGRIRMDNESINATLYEWDFGNGIKSNEEDPLITYANDGSYQIRLITWAANNCSDTTYLNYEFMYHNLFVPNALSPENVIPEVRIFKPIGVNLKEYHVEIFDAWGHLIWGSRLLDDDGRPTEGWDGTLNGEVMPQDTYVWKISATFKDGTVWEGSDIGKGTGKTMGTVTLIR